MSIKQRICSSLIKILGWKIVNNVPPEIRKYLVVMAPHTSNWDFVIGWLGFGAMGINSKFLIKNEFFVFPLGPIARALGGIPVNRKIGTGIVHQVGEIFNNNNDLVLTITPEGTRSLNRNWKRGFYFIAQHAKVPLALGFLDYKEKIGGMGKMFNITNDFDKDFEEIQEFFKDFNAKHPEKFNLSKQNRISK